MLSAFEELIAVDRTGPILVVAPLRVADTVWDAEVREWAHTHHLRVSKIVGSQKQRMHALLSKADIYTINVDNIAWLATTLYALEQQGRRIPFDWLVVDESSMFKSRAAKRFKAVRAILPAFRRRAILTGTPTPNTLQELWPQIYILDQGASLGYNPKTFIDRYFEKDFSTGNFVPKEGAERAIARAIGHMVLRLDNKDLKGMPKVVENEVRFKLPARARRLYDELERRLFVQVREIENDYHDHGIVRAVNMAVLSGKCHQIANGAVFDSEERTRWIKVHDERLDTLEELLDEISGNALVVYTYRHDRERLLERFGNVPYIGGGNKDTARVIEEWNKGKHKIVLLHPKSASHGLNIQFGGHDVVWYSNTFSGEMHDQLVARLARPGQKNKFVTSHYLIAENTVDIAMRMSVRRKAQGQTAQLEALKDYQKTRNL